MITIGIDEAGRGPVIGPMTIAGIGFDEVIAEKFKKIGVKDSKLLSIKKIYLLERDIINTTKNSMIIKVSPKDIDERFSTAKNLNYLEIDKMILIAKKLEGEKVIVDSPSKNTEKIRKYLQDRIKDKVVIAENYADKNHIEVSAASILAKAEREREVSNIKKIFNYDFGSGYPSDPKTIAFLDIIRKNGKIEQEPYSTLIRKSWYTIKKSKDEDLKLFT